MAVYDNATLSANVYGNLQRHRPKTTCLRAFQPGAKLKAIQRPLHGLPYAVSATILGAIHGVVGVLDQGLFVGAVVGIEGDADTA